MTSVVLIGATQGSGRELAALTGRLGTMADIIDACPFLLENPMVNSVGLAVDGGHP